MKDITDPIHFEALYPETSREEQIKQISEFLKRGNSCELVGLPGVGRSNIFALLSYNKNAREKAFKENEKWYHFVYMDFSEVKNRDLFDITKFIIISLSYSLGERNREEDQSIINTYLKDALEFKDDLILFQALKKCIDYLAIEKELTVVLLFDRFDEYISHVTHEFFENLKILRNRAKYRFSAIFSVSRPLEQVLEPEFYSDFYEFFVGNIVYVPLYDPEGIAFRFAYLDRIFGASLSKEANAELIRLTGGHGKLTRIGYELLLAENPAVNAGDIETILLSKVQIKGVLYEIWNSLHPEEQNVIKSLEKETAEVVKDFNYLTSVGLIKDKKLMIPLLESFIQTLPTYKKNIITYNPDRNEILQGEETLSEKLSPSEFRLLRFLLKNTGKVCEKDEIIEAVWKDEKTKEGVTDQALDQIVYRLRKKIESDPNNPLLLQTVKGRGYKLNT